MSNKFVSGGVIGAEGDAPSQGVESASSKTQGLRDGREPGGNVSEWEVVQKELEAERKRREEQRAKAAAGEEKSLYEILQDNKAAKQAAFEEQNKIRNQFRALDDDEVDFLDEVREKKRKADELVKRETEEGLRAFRERQKGEDGGEAAVEEKVDESWGSAAGGRKRRKAHKERDLLRVKKRASEGEVDKVQKPQVDDPKPVADTTTDNAPAESSNSPPLEKTKPALGLVDYGSDEDDD